MTASSRWPSGALIVVAFAVLTIAIYWPGLGGGFIFDDYPNIVDNDALRLHGRGLVDWFAAAMSSPSSVFKRPLASLTFAANLAATGIDPWAMKATNLAIHLLCGALMYVLLRLLFAAAPGADRSDGGRRAGIAALVAGAWLILPINLTGVLYVVQRMESLCHVFVLAGLALYVHGRRIDIGGGRHGYAIALAGLGFGTVLGLMAKESAALLPLYAFCVECCLFGFRGRNELVRRSLAAFYAMVAVAGLAGLGMLFASGIVADGFALRTFGLQERLLTELRVLWSYVEWTLLPRPEVLGLYHDDYAVSQALLTPPSTLAAAIAWVGVTVAAGWLRRTRPLATLGLFWFLSAHMLTATVVPLELVYEHRNYAASLGLLMVLADLLLLDPPRRWPANTRIAAAAALALLWIGTTTLRAREWGEPIRHAEAEAAHRPGSPRAAYELGFKLAVVSRYTDARLVDAALAQFERAAAVPSAGLLPLQGLLITAARTGRPQQDAWWIELEHRIAARPLSLEDGGGMDALVQCQIKGHCAFPPQRVINVFLAGLSRQPPDVRLLSGYANYAANVLGDLDLAERLTEAALQQAPDDVQARKNHEHIRSLRHANLPAPQAGGPSDATH